jgi:hypothetical protein
VGKIKNSRSGGIGRHIGFRLQKLKVQVLSSVMKKIRLQYSNLNYKSHPMKEMKRRKKVEK